MKLLRLLTMIFALVSVVSLYAQDPVKKTEGEYQTLQKKTLELDAQVRQKINFNRHLKNAGEGSRLEDAISELDLAQKVCTDAALDGCQSKVNAQVKAVFSQWLQYYQNVEDASTAETGLLRLKSKFCRGSFSSLVDCSGIDQAIAIVETNEHQSQYDKYIEEGKSARELADQLEAYAKAEAICESYLKNNCIQEVEDLKRAAYTKAFQKELRYLRSSNADFDDKQEKLEYLEELVEKGNLSASYRSQLDRLAHDISEVEVRRLLDADGTYNQKKRDIRRAQRIDEDMLNGSMSRVIEERLIDLVEEEVDDLLSRRRSGDFNRHLNRIEEAEDLIRDLPERLRAQQENELERYKNEVIQDELSQRMRSLSNTRDWRSTLDGYQDVIRFAQRYDANLNRNTLRNIRRDRENFLIGEYEARLQQSLSLLQRNDLNGAQLALTGAVELSNTGFLPEGPQKYRHREVYQKLYEEHHRQLQVAKGQRNWQLAEQKIGMIDNLYRDAPFILVRASLDEELLLLDIAKFESQLDDGGRILNSEPLANQYQFFNDLIQKYQQLRPQLNNNHQEHLGRLVYNLSKQPMDVARNAIQTKNFGMAINELSGLNQFLYQPGYRNLLPARPYDEMDQLIDYSVNQQVQIFSGVLNVIKNADEERRALNELGQFSAALNNFSGWDNQSSKAKIGSLYQSLLYKKRDRIVQQMQGGQFEYASEIREMQDIQSANRSFIPSSMITQIKNELSFYEDYEKGKAALRRGNFEESLGDLKSAKGKVEYLPSNERSEKNGLIENGLRRSLAGLLINKINADRYLGKSAQRDAYKNILRLRLDNQDVPLTQEAETAIQNLEIDWFGGACRQDYRDYTLLSIEAEEKVKANDYKGAIALYEQALPLERRVSRCMVPDDNVSDKLTFYQLAVDFNDKKAALENLKGQGNWKAFDEQYHSLWMAYKDFAIREKFGYSMQAFPDYVLDSKDPSLMQYFVRTYCTEDMYLDATKEMIRELAYRSSSRSMETLGGDVARRMFPFSPGKKYQDSFQHFIPNGKTSKAFKSFEKGYKKQWKKSWKNK